jgi:plasmid stabilization system protein ParE
MAKFELTKAADRDLTDIYAYSHRQFGERKAEEYLLSLESCLSQLAEMPGMGRSIDHIRSRPRAATSAPEHDTDRERPFHRCHSMIRPPPGRMRRLAPRLA